MFLDEPSEESSRLLDKITISDDIDFIDELFGITPEIRDLIREYYYDAKKGKKRVWRKLEQAIERYPHVPQFKNMLMIYYRASDREYKARQINQQIYEQHPDYLFGRTAQVNILLKNGKVDEVPALIGDEPDISKAFAGREQFHHDEVSKYYLAWMMYAIEVDDEEKARLCMDVLEQVNVSPDVQKNASAIFLPYVFKKGQKRLREQEEKKIFVDARSYDKERQTNEEPDFNHPQIETLYHTYIDEIEDEELTEIINLPRETLVEDVKMMLQDVINRYEFFNKRAIESDEYLDEVDFPLHAMFLAAALKEEVLLPYILDILRQGDKLIHNLFGDVNTEIFNTAIAQCGKGQLDKLRDFIEEPNIYYSSKYNIASAVVVMREIDPEFEPHSKQWLLGVIEFLVDEVNNPEIVDTDTYTLIADLGHYFEDSVCFVKPVEKLFDLEMIDPTFAGEKDSVVSRLKNTNIRDIYSHYFSGSLIQMYEQAREKWHYMITSGRSDAPYPINDEWDYKSDNEKLIGKPVSQERDVYKDVGRNDPCPCGSGKKFKKCCLKKIG